MAVTVLLGKAGSGKSTQCYRDIQACAAAGGKALLLVPDQATYGPNGISPKVPMDRAF